MQTVRKEEKIVWRSPLLGILKRSFFFFFFSFIVFGEDGDQDAGIFVGNKEEGYEIFMEESWRYGG